VTAVRSGGFARRGAVSRSGLVLVLALAGAARIALAAEDPPAPDAGRGPAEWLRMIHDAAEHRSYAGTIVYQQGDSIEAARIVHRFERGVVEERVQPLDGGRREFVRRGDEVACYEHDLKRVVVEQGAFQSDRFPALGTATAAEDILRHYELNAGNVEHVAGMPCRVLVLAPRDALRYGYRLCAELASGLLLRFQTRNESGALVEQMAFTEVRIGDHIAPVDVQPSWPAQGWTTDRHVAQPVDLQRLGWSLTPPPGFRLLREVSRTLDEREGAAAQPSQAQAGSGRDAARAPTLQALLSDGLASVSVFIDANPPALPAGVAQRNGAVTWYARRVADSTILVVGEVPPAIARAVADSVVRRDAH